MSVILHSDLNCFYASVEMNEQPQLKGKKVAVCGSTENRHGIVLTASYPAKRSGVKTGMANWQAKQACPGLIMVDPHYDLYLKYSRIVRRIYQRYSEIIEPFGMDENWIQLPFTNDVEGIGFRTAEEIRKTVESETGLTVSIGVSFSKIFAKLGSDMKKPNAVTVIPRTEYKEKVWPLPVSDLLYVGPATTRKLTLLGCQTIYGARLSGWANAHIDRVSLRFSKTYTGDHRYVYTFGQMNSKEAVENAFKFLDLSGKMTIKDMQRAADRLVDEMPLSFHGALAYIMKGRCTVDELVGRIPISRSTLLRLRTEERKQYNLDQVVAICVGLHLPPWLSDILLDRAHLTVKRYGPLAYYGIILDCFYMDTIQDVQDFVKNSGFDPLQLNFDAE